MPCYNDLKYISLPLIQFHIRLVLIFFVNKETICIIRNKNMFIADYTYPKSTCAR